VTARIYAFAKYCPGFLCDTGVVLLYIVSKARLRALAEGVAASGVAARFKA
jgi:hypothetical protein